MEYSGTSERSGAVCGDEAGDSDGSQCTVVDDWEGAKGRQAGATDTQTRQANLTNRAN